MEGEMAKKAIHWAPLADVLFAKGTRLRRWAVCCSGDKCEQIGYEGNQSDTLAEVTCAKCWNIAEQARKWDAGQRALIGQATERVTA